MRSEVTAPAANGVDTLSNPASASVENEEPGGNVYHNDSCKRDFATGREGTIADFDGNGAADGFRLVANPTGSDNLLQIRYDKSGSWVTVNKTAAAR